MRDFTLEAAALEWLRYEHRCKLVTFQRGVFYSHNPDVFGVEPSRRCIEIECKRSVGDFKADEHKRVTQLRRLGIVNVWKFYFLVTPQIVERVRPLLPAGAGLLTLDSDLSKYTHIHRVRCLVGAQCNAHARRLNPREVAVAVAAQTATLQRVLAMFCRQSLRVQNTLAPVVPPVVVVGT